MDETCGRMQGQRVRHAEGVALSGVPVNKEPHGDTTLEILIELRAEGARVQALISQAKGQGRKQALIRLLENVVVFVIIT